MHFEAMNPTALQAELTQLEQQYSAHLDAGYALDLTRGKPSIAQLELSNPLDQTLAGNYQASDGTDSRGYGGLDGLPEAKAIGAALMDLAPEEVIVGGNSSLTLMYLFLMHAYHFGPGADARPWRDEAGATRFLCPSPGYDRHFAICEDLGIELVNVTMNDHGPDMDQVEALVAADPSIKGIWCVPKYSNPTGVIYSHDVVRRVAGLAKQAGANFRVMWDNAYSVHDLYEYHPLPSIMAAAKEVGTQEHIALFSSTSKITFAGAGLAFFGSTGANLQRFRERLGVLTIGPDKVNQLRHARWLKDLSGIAALMARHAELLRPKFTCVEQYLREGLGNLGLASWTEPRGGYFVSCDLRPGMALEVVRLAHAAGVKLTPAGAAFPYGKDPEDRNIRLAPSFPSTTEVAQAMQVFVTCVKLAAVRQLLNG